MTQSTLFHQLLKILQGKEGQILSSTQIKKMMEQEYGANPSSVIPTDYCYNRINAGVAFDKHLFVRVARSEFKFVGRNYPYSGRVFWHPKGGDHEQIVAEWENGTLRYLDGFDALAKAPAQKLAESEVAIPPGVAVLTQQQIQKLYEEYCAILALEVDVFGIKATEVRHLIGRIGEFKCALLTGGSLAQEVNQHGFDVVAAGRKISVKTTAQRQGFVAINKKTVHKADDLMLLQYASGDFRVVYYGCMDAATAVARTYGDKFELDISKAEGLRGCSDGFS